MELKPTELKPAGCTSPPPPSRSCRRQWFGQVSAISFASGMAGCGSGARGQPASRFRVTGPSMIPTLVPDHRSVVCGECGVVLRVPAEPSSAADRATFRCWHCGRHHPIPRGPVVPGDVVELRGPPANSARRTIPRQIGDLTATDHGGRLTVKRLLALPGMTVGLDSGMADDRPPRLTVDGLFPDQIDSFSVPSLPVDFDARRDDSRWTPTLGSTAWRRVEGGWVRDGVRPATTASASDWLIYRHRNVYQDHRRSPVFDDVPENVADPRPLRPVDRVDVGFVVTCRTDSRLEVVRWHRWGIATETFPVGTTATSIRSGGIVERLGRDSATVGRRDHPPVGPSQPIAIRVASVGQRDPNGGRDPDGAGEPDGPSEQHEWWRLGEIVVERPVEYRLLARHDRDRYPIRLGADECFLVGDNVPVSVDSRDWGPVPIGKLRRCQRITNR